MYPRMGQNGFLNLSFCVEELDDEIWRIWEFESLRVCGFWGFGALGFADSACCALCCGLPSNSFKNIVLCEVVLVMWK